MLMGENKKAAYGRTYDNVPILKLMCSYISPK